MHLQRHKIGRRKQTLLDFLFLPCGQLHRRRHIDHADLPVCLDPVDELRKDIRRIRKMPLFQQHLQQTVNLIGHPAFEYRFEDTGLFFLADLRMRHHADQFRIFFQCRHNALCFGEVVVKTVLLLGDFVERIAINILYLLCHVALPISFKVSSTRLS